MWPQGHLSQWGSCGSDCDALQEEETGKNIHKVDDLTFLTNMIATIVKSKSESNPAKDRVDAKRVYATGFSMGCMMSHRLALERSAVLAGFGCHGGTLNQKKNANLATEKERFSLREMPAYMTGGTKDSWFDVEPFDKWAAWNACSNTTQTQDVNFNAGTPSTAKLSIRPSCNSTPLDIRRLAITNGTHVMDERMAKYIWEYLNNENYVRAGALEALPSASVPAAETSTQDGTSSGGSKARKHAIFSFVALLAALFIKP